MHDPKSQPVSDKHNFTCTSKNKKTANRSEAAKVMRKIKRRIKRAEHRRQYRRLRKCQDVLATHRDTYTVAQECSSTTEPATVTCPSHNVFLQPPQDPSNPIPQQQTLEHITQDIKIASLNLGGGINHLSGRQKIVHLMESQRIDILALQETRVNNNSVEQHGDYIFYFSTSVNHEQKSRAEKERQRQSKLSCKTLSEIELYNLDAEKQGVALVYHKKMQKPKLNVKQINGRLMLVTFDTVPIRTNLIAVYAPHSGRNDQELEQFYHDLTGLLSEIPKHEINVLLGDWNVRLQERLPHESHVIGPHVFRDEHSKIENLNDDQRRNRIEFIMFCQNHGYVVTNTWFEKPISKLVTYRNPTSLTFEPPYNTNKFGQLDFILVNQRWRNSFHNVETSLPQAITSDHKVLMAHMKTKLAKPRTKTLPSRKHYRQPTDEQIQDFNRHVEREIQDKFTQVVEDPFQIWASALLTAAENTLTQIPPEQRKPYLSEETWNLLTVKQGLIADGKYEEAKDAEKEIRKHLRRERKQFVKEKLEEIDRDGYKWQGIKKLKQTYLPKHTKYKDMHGLHISEAKFPEKAAEYLSQIQWKPPEGPPHVNDQILTDQGAGINDEEWALEEFNAVIQKIKPKKAPGPDNVQGEFIRWLDQDNRRRLLELYNDILMKQQYPDSLNQANIASIYKKGDPAKLENYRPIALLQVFYKLLASLLKLRLTDHLEPWILKTQYGFRKKRSTSQPLFIARRLMDIAERQRSPLTLILLDWAKAFDKIDQTKLIEALIRIKVPDKIIAVIKNIYANAQFRVVTKENQSNFYKQCAGIRQGCPLSPYLFTIVMTAIFQDIKQMLKTPRQLAPIPGINYAEVLYADDTLIFGTHTQSINKFLQAIQVESAKYNMLLNFDKCVNITINQHQSSVKFLNGTSVPRKDQAKYLGATLTDTVDNRQELSQRIGAVVATARQLNPLWFQARTSKTWKIRVFESTLASKLLYGLESMQLTLSEQKLIDNFQMKMLRKILGVPSTYVNRAWTNQAVLHELSQRYGYKHIRLSTKWKHKKITLLGHIIRAESEDPMREVLFETGTFRPRVEHIRRVGKPRANWLIETYKDAHTIIDNVTPFDINDIHQIQTLHGKAQRRETPFTTPQNS